jgi:hypothetical protein
MAVAAEDPPGANCLFLWTPFVIATQKAVPNQEAGHLAMRARRRLELLENREKVLFAPEKPSPVAHVGAISLKADNDTGGKLRAGYEKN